MNFYRIVIEKLWNFAVYMENRIWWLTDGPNRILFLDDGVKSYDFLQGS